MPIVFDFDNGVDPGQVNNNVTNTTQTVSYTENGIDMTLAADVLAGTAHIQFAGTGSGSPLFFNDKGADDTFLLTFNGGTISGTGGSPIVITAGGGTGTNGAFQVVFTHNTLPDVIGGTVNGSGQTASATGVFHGIKFVSLGGAGTNNYISFQSLTVKNATCFTAGVRLSTPEGAKEVQDLVPGDRLLTAEGGITTVKWLGRQEISTRFSIPEAINPICISKGALADCVPSRDLHVSPDHAIAIGDLLINAGALVNDTSIYQVAEMPKDGFIYYHVETDGHELLLAEGCPAESYLDVPDRSSFVNGAERANVPPIEEMGMIRISASRLVPAQVQATIAERAGITVRVGRAA